VGQGNTLGRIRGNDMTLRLPPPSEPEYDRPRHVLSTKVDPCPLCPHDWHGLTCRYGSCFCNTSIPKGRDDE
jgi:hypothetical protein